MGQGREPRGGWGGARADAQGQCLRPFGAANAPLILSRDTDSDAMAITKIKVSNFKSFDELEIDLRPLNVVVGGNASGKSNFLEIFRFLRAIWDHGLENAVS